MDSILKIVAWPAVVLVIGIVAMFVFKNELRGALNRVRKTQLPGGSVVEFGEAPVDKPLQETPAAAPGTAKAEQPEKASIKWGNTGNVFFAGMVLMRAIDMLLRGAPKERVVEDLEEALHHVRCLGFTSSAIEGRLAAVKMLVNMAPEQEWTLGRRQEYAAVVTLAMADIGALAAANQPGFSPKPQE